MPEGPSNSVILRAATRPRDVDSVPTSAEEGLDVCVFGSEAHDAHARRAMPVRTNVSGARVKRGEVVIVHAASRAGVDPGSLSFTTTLSLTSAYRSTRATR